ncbi:MAG: hypothetical protein R6T98_06370, partial [Desulfatiglandales bacterium]
MFHKIGGRGVQDAPFASLKGKFTAPDCTGEIIHDIKVFSLDSVIRKHDINSFATPTPAIEDGF